MWSRATLKSRAKAKLFGSYWPIVLVSFIFLLVSGSGGSSDTSELSEYADTLPPEVIATILTTILILSLITILLSIFVFFPISVGCRRYFINLENGTATYGDMLCAFRENYWNVVKIGVLHGLYIFLWTLLLIIPGIIKSYAYRMVPYILAEDTGISSSKVFNLSSDLMDNNKFASFVLDLSFLGWELLSMFTLGILGVFFVNPYVCLTETELYLHLSGTRARYTAGSTYGNQTGYYHTQSTNTGSSNAYGGYADIYRNAYGQSDTDQNKDNNY